jgi:hypothetical protein
VPPLSDRGGELVEGDRQAPVHRRLDRQLVGPRRRFCTKAWPAITTLALWSCCKPRIGRSRDFRRPWSASTRLLAYCSRFDATVPPAAPPARSVGRCTVGDHLNGCDPCGTDHALEEPSGCPDVAPRGDEHVDDLAELIDRSVHLPPLAGDLHLRLIHEPAISHRMPTWPGRLGPGRALNPHGDQSTRGSQRVVAKVQCSIEAWWKLGSDQPPSTLSGPARPLTNRSVDSNVDVYPGA